jgi:hypothetical protein
MWIFLLSIFLLGSWSAIYSKYNITSFLDEYLRKTSLFAYLSSHFIDIFGTTNTHISKNFDDCVEFIKPTCLQFIIFYNEKYVQFSLFYKEMYTAHPVLKVAADYVHEMYKRIRSFILFIHNIYFLDILPFSRKEKWIEYCIKIPSLHISTTIMTTTSISSTINSRNNAVSTKTNTTTKTISKEKRSFIGHISAWLPNEQLQIIKSKMDGEGGGQSGEGGHKSYASIYNEYNKSYLSSFVDEINNMHEFMNGKKSNLFNEKGISICSILGKYSDLLQPLYEKNYDDEFIPECLTVYNSSYDTMYMRVVRTLPFSNLDMDSTIEKDGVKSVKMFDCDQMFSEKKSRVKFLAIEYVHSRNNGNHYFLEVEDSLMINGNEILSYCHVWKLLSLIPSYKRPVFDNTYELHIIDGMANEIRLNSMQYVRLKNNNCVVV